MAEDEEKPQPSQYAVSLKLPPFWPNDPRIWFVQVEAQFMTRNITQQQTKYNVCVCCVRLTARNCIGSPRLTFRMPRRSALRYIERGINQTHFRFYTKELGDRKPSQLLQRMRQLLGDHKLHMYM